MASWAEITGQENVQFTDVDTAGDDEDTVTFASSETKISDDGSATVEEQTAASIIQEDVQKVQDHADNVADDATKVAGTVGQSANEVLKDGPLSDAAVEDVESTADGLVKGTQQAVDDTTAVNAVQTADQIIGTATSGGSSDGTNASDGPTPEDAAGAAKSAAKTAEEHSGLISIVISAIGVLFTAGMLFGGNDG